MDLLENDISCSKIPFLEKTMYKIKHLIFLEAVSVIL